MHKLVSAAVLTLALSAGSAFAQTAGQQTLGVTVDQLQQVVAGWSAKKQFLGSTVYNENKDKVGKIDDLIVAPDGNVSFIVIGAGGFVGVGKHEVAIPVSQLQVQDGKITLPGATKKAVKELPEFEYSKEATKKFK